MAIGKKKSEVLIKSNYGGGELTLNSIQVAAPTLR